MLTRGYLQMLISGTGHAGVTLRTQLRGEKLFHFAEMLVPRTAAGSLGGLLQVGHPPPTPLVSDHGLHLQILFLPNRKQSQELREGQGHKFPRSEAAPATRVGFLVASESPVVWRRTELTSS